MITLFRCRSTAFATLAFGSYSLFGCAPAPSSAVPEPPSTTANPTHSATSETVAASTTPAATGPHESAIGQKDILVVSFFSPGDGTDHAAYDRLQAMLKGQPKVPPHVSHLWGKEGEHDECFDLASLSAADREAFLSRVKDAVRSSKKVNVTENGTCHEGR